MARPAWQPERGFWERLDRRPNGCWEWTGFRTAKGYGNCRRSAIQSAPLLVHRLAWMLINGPIPVGVVVRHKCDNPPCCNPAHLELGTLADNNRDMRERGRASKPPSRATWTHCSHGHELTPENRAPNGEGKIRCRICKHEYDRAAYHAGRYR